MDSISQPATLMRLKVVFLGFPIPGHLLHIIDTASTFASYGVETTLITTPANLPFVENALPTSNFVNQLVKIRLVSFPYEAVGLPTGVENYSAVNTNELRAKLFQAFVLLQKPIEDLILEIAPDCIISDMFYPWTADFAIQIGVPRVVFKGCGVFPMCCWHSVKSHAPHENVDMNEELFTLPSLPDEIKMARSQLPDWVRNPNGYTYLMNKIDEAELKSYGTIVNSFYELEPAYEDYYKNVKGVKIWTIGPISLHVGRNDEQKGVAEWISWLDQKKPNSVVYVNFGGVAKFPLLQLKEIALGLEASECDFVWIVRRSDETLDDQSEDWSLDEFKKRMNETNKGLIIEKWVPQLWFLEHKSTGGMITHVGWGTMIEGITAGLPLVTWPLYAEQFYNERLVVDVLKIGVPVGVTTFSDTDKIGKKETIGRERIEGAVRSVMDDGEEAKAMRKRVTELSKAAKKAVQSGGSSKANIEAFLKELSGRRRSTLC